MKLEKLNDNQIRCTLNKADLTERELKISELAYGTDKAKELFREMMQQASYEFGFEAEDIPLMIEAIPISADCIILVITKVEDPEELDTRFSKFAPSNDEADSNNDELNDAEDDDITSLFSKIQELRDSIVLDENDMDKVEEISGNTDPSDDFVAFKDSFKKASSGSDKDKVEEIPSIKRITRILTFDSFDKIEQACSFATNISDTSSSLYKDADNNIYYLVLTLEGTNADAYNQLCNSLSEFGTRIKTSYATESYYKEHFEIIIKNNAVNVLKNL